ncbi:MAG: hypothetical protein H5U07_07470 [Candidatus Aminicenantes bacterium]|nr:hypothetical protein [Candidatus Aminicenantes bacterium]
MEKKQVDFLKPAVLAGAVAGLISAVPFFNCLCCLWIIAAAAFSVYLLAQKSEASLKSSDGFLAGILTGLVASLVNGLLEIPLRPVYLSFFGRFFEAMSSFMEEMPSGWENLTQMRDQGFNLAWFLLELLLSSILFSLFGAIGGLIGYSLFAKKKESGEKDVQTLPQDHSHS